MSTFAQRVNSVMATLGISIPESRVKSEAAKLDAGLAYLQTLGETVDQVVTIDPVTGTAGLNPNLVVPGVNDDASVKAAPGKIPRADAGGLLDSSWFASIYPSLKFNDIGVPGADGFGVGICPVAAPGYTPLAGTLVKGEQYGNYQYSDGSVMVWIPAFYLRRAHADNPTFATYGVNSIDIKPLSAFPSKAAANAASYYLHRAFVNAGQNQLGFFRDKFDCSNNGGIASSIKNVQPMVSSPATGQVGFSALNGSPANAHYGAIPAAKTRGAKFFPESVFIADALSCLSEAHAQAATASTYCAWYDASGVRSYPKGNDNNALKSESDVLQNGAGAVSFTSAGVALLPHFALAGSGSNMARTTHNGQSCGITDVAGNIYKLNPGLTCIATALAITAATQANPVALTVTGHGRTTGDVVLVTGVGGMTPIKDNLYTVTVVDPNTVRLDGVDGTAFPAFTSGGTLTGGTFYTLKESADIAAITSGNTISTDHWGATGVAANFDPITLNFATTYPNNAVTQRFGNGANAVFGWSSAEQRLRSMLGMPAAAGVSPEGSNLMGLDYFYQYIRNDLFVLSRGGFAGLGILAGSRTRSLGNRRTDVSNSIGFACASYL